MCECPTSNNACISDGVLCSNHGECKCGQCQCETIYEGEFCDTCTMCSFKCLELSKCIECEHFKKDRKLFEHCAENNRDCSNINITAIDEIDDYKPDNSKQHYCFFNQMENGCQYKFYFDKKPGSLNKEYIRVQKELRCPSKWIVIAAVAGVIGSIILLGVGTLLVWKILTTIHDQREFACFEEAQKNASWNVSFCHFKHLCKLI